MLRIFTSLCNTANIDYWIVGGVLNSIVTCNGVWRADSANIDLCVSEKDYPKLKTLTLPDSIFLQDHTQSKKDIMFSLTVIYRISV